MNFPDQRDIHLKGSTSVKCEESKDNSDDSILPIYTLEQG